MLDLAKKLFTKKREKSWIWRCWLHFCLTALIGFEGWMHDVALLLSRVIGRLRALLTEPCQYCTSEDMLKEIEELTQLHARKLGLTGTTNRNNGKELESDNSNHRHLLFLSMHADAMDASDSTRIGFLYNIKPLRLRNRQCLCSSFWSLMVVVCSCFTEILFCRVSRKSCYKWSVLQQIGKICRILDLDLEELLNKDRTFMEELLPT